MAQTNPKPQLFILVNNHFDPTWRRCWQRPLKFKGKTFISYNDIETYYLLDNIALAQENSEYKFEIECALVLRTILKDHPEALPILQQLAQEGRFAVSGAGETIVDANMIHGESLVRNFVDGILWVEDTLGQKTNYMLRNDAFGDSGLNAAGAFVIEHEAQRIGSRFNCYLGILSIRNPTYFNFDEHE